MARWKLLTPHYLKVLGTEWEYKEIDRRTGRERRAKVSVPQYLDPRDPADWTSSWGNRDNGEGEIIVCLHDKGQPGDIEFVGDPTPDMAPLDDEALSISASFSKRWAYKPETGPGDFSQSLIDKFQADMIAVQAKQSMVPGLEDLVKVLSILAGQGQIQPPSIVAGGGSVEHQMRRPV